VENCLIECPVCKGLKIVKKTSRDGKVCYYKDRITAVKEPCENCNGNGIIVKKEEK